MGLGSGTRKLALGFPSGRPSALPAQAGSAVKSGPGSPLDEPLWMSSSAPGVVPGGVFGGGGAELPPSPKEGGALWDGLLALPVAEWQKTFEDKLLPLFSVRESLSEEEALKMGKKDPEQEVENFVTSNTLELGKDKWQCPLSGKKFKVRLPSPGDRPLVRQARPGCPYHRPRLS